jgi:hypothetical protein
LLLWWWRWRRRRLTEIEHPKDALGSGEFAFSIEIEKDKEKRKMNPDDRRDGTAAIPSADVRPVGHAPVNASNRVRVARKKERRAGDSPDASSTYWLSQRLELLLRPPPWLALPPLLAISRCFAGSIAANPRLDPPLLVVAIFFLPNCRLATL